MAGGIDDSWTVGPVEESGRLARWAADWVIVPAELADWVPPVSYMGLVALVLVLTLIHGWWRIALLVPTLYLASFVWENVLLAKPESTRYIVIGAVLVATDDRAPAGAPRREARRDRLMAERLLDLQRVSMAFGGLKVVDSLDLHVDEGEIVCVIGPNGAGKTTLFNLVTGIYEPTEGEILFAGEPITGLEPHQITRRGSRGHSRRCDSSST